MMNDILPKNFKSWTRNNQDKVGVHLIRFMFGLLWLSMGLSKIFIRHSNPYEDHAAFLGDLNWMAETHPSSFIASIIRDVIIANLNIFLVLVIIIEVFIGISIGLGIFTRLGSILGGLMTINLWIFTLGWDEWIWTYPLIFFPHVMFFLYRPGREIGFDRILSEKDNNLYKLLS